MPDADRSPAVPAHDFRDGGTFVACARCGEARWDVLTFGICRDAGDIAPGGDIHVDLGGEALCGWPERRPPAGARRTGPCADCFAAIGELPRLDRPHDVRVAGDRIACADCGLTASPSRGLGFPCDGRVLFAAMKQRPRLFGPPRHMPGCRYYPGALRSARFPLERVTCRHCMRGLARAPRLPQP